MEFVCKINDILFIWDIVFGYDLQECRSRGLCYVAQVEYEASRVAINTVISSPTWGKRKAVRAGKTLKNRNTDQ